MNSSPLLLNLILLGVAVLFAVMGLQMRAGRWLNLYRPLGVSAPSSMPECQRFGRYVGQRWLALSVLVLTVTLALWLLPEPWLALVLLLVAPIELGLYAQLFRGHRWDRRAHDVDAV